MINQNCFRKVLAKLSIHFLPSSSASSSTGRGRDSKNCLPNLDRMTLSHTSKAIQRREKLSEKERKRGSEKKTTDQDDQKGKLSRLRSINKYERQEHR